jgi:histidyl-tRNA synthetase
MVYEHEIPKGARLYFGKSAKLKRDIENIASNTLYKEGFEEIITPLFSYHQHQYIEDERELIRLSDEKNRKLSLRADSTIDVVRLITKRLGRSTEHKRWFYIQPIYRFPTHEFYQIGAEILDSKDIAKILKIVIKIFKDLAIFPKLQLSNIKIPHILDKKYNLSLETLKSSDIDKILENENSWIERLLFLSSANQIDELIGVVPEDIEVELLKLKEVADFINYENLIIAPLYYAKMRYYEELFFRFFDENSTLAMGGEYESEDLEASGFAIYIDNIIELKKVENES